MGCARPSQARPGNALDAASSRRMSHRRYGKPVRLGYKGPGSLLCASQRRCLFSRALSSPSSAAALRPSPPALSPLYHRSQHFSICVIPPLPRLSFFPSCPSPRSLHREDLAGSTVVLGILGRHFVALFDKIAADN